MIISHSVSDLISQATKRSVQCKLGVSSLELGE